MADEPKEILCSTPGSPEAEREILARLAQGEQEIASGEGYDLASVLAEAEAKLAREGNREAFERVLAKVPDVEPDPWDRW